MPATEYGPDFFREFADMQRRLKTLEFTARTGLQGIQGATDSGGLSTSTPGAWENVGPDLTMITGERCIVLLQARTTPNSAGNTMGIHYIVNGSPLVSEDPLFRVVNATGAMTLSGFFFNDALVRGTNVFQFRIFATSGSDVFTDPKIAVIPVDV